MSFIALRPTGHAIIADAIRSLTERPEGLAAVLSGSPTREDAYVADTPR
ncbi:hypothetical protein K9B33_06285 [Sphingobium sp. 3R8]|uniref:Uncharacterized protein n=1 Tax=Sphingomonas bisphenolicum TaxID=296544 RepID=A0ABN5WJS8_9SPHN|nr:hypothetical protein [Sphingobium sp. 3R8]MBZ9647143.1 hypothetical protein [Sphingobium sp. 3R8]BBF69557.1 hypothetical protein SBA_ch1_17570 [Sphingomonas bisphenolicum]